ncbi:MAG: hypothetical protein ACR2QM_01510 [Longimicrobiales bacterium]
MSPDTPTGVRLSQEQIRLVEMAIREAIIEEVDEKLEAAEAGKEAELTDRLAKVDELLARPAATGGGPSKMPSPKLLGGVGAGLIAVSALMVFFLVPGRVDKAIDGRAGDLASMTTAIEEAHATIGQNSAAADSLTQLIVARADELQLAAGASSFRADVAESLKNDLEFVRLAAGPPGPPGPAGGPPAGVRYGQGIAYFEAGGTSLASMGLSAQGSGHAQVHNRSGGRVALVGASSRGDGLLRVNSNRDAAAVDIRTGTDSTAVTLQNGSAYAALATPTRGVAQLTVAGRGGDGGVTIRSRDGLGAILVNGRTAHDLAEVFDLVGRADVTPGTVLSAANDRGELGLSRGAYDRRVVGVVSGAGGYVPGMILGSRDDGSTDLPVAINGQVFVRVSHAGGDIEPGDLLVASDMPGVAMRGSDEGRLTGAVIGKALEASREGDEDGLVKMLVMTR